MPLLQGRRHRVNRRRTTGAASAEPAATIRVTLKIRDYACIAAHSVAAPEGVAGDPLQADGRGARRGARNLSDTNGIPA